MNDKPSKNATIVDGFDRLDNHVFKEVHPTPEKLVQSCINNNHRKTHYCETVKSLNIAMKLNTDLDIFKSGIQTVNYLQH